MNNEKIQSSYLRAGKSQSPVVKKKLTMSNLLRLYFIEMILGGGKLMDRDLIEVT